jgi:hypothetical protein
MKPVRALVIALLGYGAALVPGISQAASVQLSLPGISVRLPAPPLPIILPPGVTFSSGGDYDRGYEYRRMPPPPPRYYREDWRRERWEDRGYYGDRHQEFDHDRDHGHDHDHGRDGWRR